MADKRSYRPTPGIAGGVMAQVTARSELVTTNSYGASSWRGTMSEERRGVRRTERATKGPGPLESIPESFRRPNRDVEIDTEPPNQRDPRWPDGLTHFTIAEDNDGNVNDGADSVQELLLDHFDNFVPLPA